MGIGMTAVGLLLVTTAVLLCNPSLVAASVYVVGGDNIGKPNWRPCCDRYGYKKRCCTVKYSAWARQMKFVVGDRLDFYFNTSFSTVLEVSEDAYNSCHTVPVKDGATTSPVTLTLNSTGVKYFVSTGYYCALQRMIVDVAANPDDEKNSSRRAQRNKILGGVLGPVLAALIGAIATGLCKYWRKKKLDQPDHIVLGKPAT